MSTDQSASGKSQQSTSRTDRQSPAKDDGLSSAINSEPFSRSDENGNLLIYDPVKKPVQDRSSVVSQVENSSFDDAAQEDITMVFDSDSTLQSLRKPSQGANSSFDDSKKQTDKATPSDPSEPVTMGKVVALDPAEESQRKEAVRKLHAQLQELLLTTKPAQMTRIERLKNLSLSGKYDKERDALVKAASEHIANVIFQNPSFTAEKISNIDFKSLADPIKTSLEAKLQNPVYKNKNDQAVKAAFKDDDNMHFSFRYALDNEVSKQPVVGTVVSPPSPYGSSAYLPRTPETPPQVATAPPIALQDSGTTASPITSFNKPPPTAEEVAAQLSVTKNWFKTDIAELIARNVSNTSGLGLSETERTAALDRVFNSKDGERLLDQYAKTQKQEDLTPLSNAIVKEIQAAGQQQVSPVNLTNSTSLEDLYPPAPPHMNQQNFGATALPLDSDVTTSHPSAESTAHPEPAWVRTADTSKKIAQEAPASNTPTKKKDAENAIKHQQEEHLPYAAAMFGKAEKEAETVRQEREKAAAKKTQLAEASKERVQEAPAPNTPKQDKTPGALLAAAEQPMSEKMKEAVKAEAQEAREREIEYIHAAIHEKLIKDVQPVKMSMREQAAAKSLSGAYTVEQQALISAVTTHITEQIAQNEAISTDKTQSQSIIKNISNTTKTIVDEMLKKPEYKNKTTIQIQDEFRKDIEFKTAITLAAKEAVDKSTPKSKEPKKLQTSVGRQSNHLL